MTGLEGLTPEIAASGVEEALKVLRARWKLIIVFYLFRDGTLRLSELERAIPRITQKMLIQQLRGLERHGVVRQANPRTFMARLVGSIGQRLPTMFIFKIYV